MKKTLQILKLFITVLIILFPRCRNLNDDTYRFQLKFVTENYKPFNYVENSSVTGLAPEVLKEICKRLSIPYEVTVLPWDEGYQVAREDEHAVLFSTVLNAERKDLFKWAGPIASVDWMFYTSSQNQISLNSLDDAKQVSKIGVMKDYAIEQYLLQQGFTNLYYCTDNVQAFDKLLKGEIDLFPSDRFTAEAALLKLNKSIYTVTNQLTIMTDLVYFAFNKRIPDDVVADFQSEIDRLKENGVLPALYRQFMNSTDIPGTLQIYTEQYPPISFRNAFGDITGFGSDIVYEIMKRNHLFANVKLSLWSNGYQLALNNPNFCLFTMDRTPIRENLFQWVGPIGTNTTWFYTRLGSGIRITSLDEARNLNAVGTVSSWFSEQYLLNLGFRNLVSGTDPGLMTKKLMNGEIDAFVCTDVTFPDILKSQDYQYSQVIPSFSLMSSDYYIAFSNTTPAALIRKWQSSLQAMKLDGSYDAIFHKWFP